jgi:hypothetical protein
MGPVPRPRWLACGGASTAGRASPQPLGDHELHRRLATRRPTHDARWATVVGTPRDPITNPFRRLKPGPDPMDRVALARANRRSRLVLIASIVRVTNLVDSSRRHLCLGGENRCGGPTCRRRGLRGTTPGRHGRRRSPARRVSCELEAARAARGIPHHLQRLVQPLPHSLHVGVRLSSDVAVVNYEGTSKNSWRVGCRVDSLAPVVQGRR